MRIVIIGGTGQIGPAVAWDLARDPEVETRYGEDPAASIRRLTSVPP